MAKRRRRGLFGTRTSAQGKCEVSVPASMADVRACAKTCGSHWFDPGSMRFFHSRVGRSVFTDGAGGAYFISSEQYDSSSARLYSVRFYDPKTCSIGTIGAFQGYRSAASATTAAKRLAKAGGLSGARRRRRR